MVKDKLELFAIGDDGSPVDWWFLYKIAGKSIASDGSKPTGTEYVYFDSNKKDDIQLELSANDISDAANGAVSGTLNQIYNNADDTDMGWFFYNDEDPITGKTNGERGHTKGILCFNTVTNTAFWMIHSAPKFPPKGKYSYPATATENAQTFLCITLQDADTAKAIAAQMFVGQQPNVYEASNIPAGMDQADPRAELIKDTVTTSTEAYADAVQFKSKGGQTFRCIAKNKHWDKANDDDFYNDLVGPILAESLDVETWEHDPEPGSMDSDKVHTVMAMKTIDLAPLKTDPSFEWSEENDHAKLAISAAEQVLKFICVGDINFTKAQEKRSGGTVAFIYDNLWQSISEIMSDAVMKKSNDHSVVKTSTIPRYKKEKEVQG